jgi:hypothetical protein
MGFSGIDYAVLAAYLVGITIFGSRFRHSHRSVKDYFLGSRQTSWVVIGLSIVATETSTLTLIGVPALAYTAYARPEQGGSFTYLQVVTGYVVARFVISALLIPAYFQGEMLTAYELLHKRFGPSAKHFAASLFLVMRALAEGVRVFAASLVLAAVVGASIPALPHRAVVDRDLGVLTLVCTFEGGIAAGSDGPRPIGHIRGWIAAGRVHAADARAGRLAGHRCRRPCGGEAPIRVVVLGHDRAVHVLGRSHWWLFFDHGVARNRSAVGAALADLP